MILIIWIFLCIILAIAGSKRNIGWAGAFFLSLFLSPLIGFIVVMVSDKKGYSGSSSLIVVNKDGSDKTLRFKEIDIKTPYIQKSPTTGAYKVYMKRDKKDFKFLKDFNGFVEAKDYVIKLYDRPQQT